jgi:hypothetical protein
LRKGGIVQTQPVNWIQKIKVNAMGAIAQSIDNLGSGHAGVQEQDYILRPYYLGLLY